ncbi:PDZ domain-containing protein [Asticcacaulis taihuensis]|uniref:PDZ domain (Also known as DHR or GLGF) n=1 Tax=Asticcacaulis taihuensis TaxID=260084 RepID=A0A1G4SYD8_9CAUL|nr:PDZ domain-containing protein [Asticcacaulis taihuensis]SCW73309.1 PDZ domain (Also known as DHR or GLGF) [Asticcacaulis taihuensis]
MRNMLEALAISGLVMSFANNATAREVPLTQHVVGAAPTWDQAISTGERAIKDRMVDPDSTKIEWPYQFSAVSRKAPFGKTRYGYFTCGTVNSKNRMGGYSGKQWFLIMLKDGAVTDLEIDSPGDGQWTAYECLADVKAGNLVPITINASSHPAPATSLITKPVMGIDFAAVPEGAYIGKVTPKGAADQAGLKPGMVIAEVNGISLKGMTLAGIQSIFTAIEGEMNLMVVGVGEVRMHKAIPSG